MFSIREFVKKGLLDGIGKKSDYEIIFNALERFDKGDLTLEDLEEINAKIDSKNNPYRDSEVPDEPREPEPVEESEDDLNDNTEVQDLGEGSID